MSSKHLKILSALILFTPIALADVVQNAPIEGSVAESVEVGPPVPAEGTVTEPAELGPPVAAGESVDEPAEEAQDAPVEESVAEPAELGPPVAAGESADEPAEEVQDTPAEESVAKSAEELQDTSTEESVPGSAEMFAEKSETATTEEETFQAVVATPSSRFTYNDNGTVTDNQTGLIWLKNANCLGRTKNWNEAIMFVTTLGTGTNVCHTEPRNLTDGSSKGDWHLPTIKELQSLVHYGFINPALPNTEGTSQWVEGQPFSGVKTNYYWSSTTYAGSASNAWGVGLSNGYVNASVKTRTYSVWPVRGGQ